MVAQQPEPHVWVVALSKIILAMNMFVKHITMSAAMKPFNTNLRLPAQPLFDIFVKGTACICRSNRSRQAGKNATGTTGEGRVRQRGVYLREGKSRSQQALITSALHHHRAPHAPGCLPRALSMLTTCHTPHRLPHTIHRDPGGQRRGCCCGQWPNYMDKHERTGTSAL